MLKVLTVLDSLGMSGAERSTLGMVPGLRAHDIEVEVAHFAKVEASQQVYPDIKTHSVAGSGRAGKVRGVRQLVVERRPDLVHTTLFESDVAGRLAARSAGVPVVSSLVNMSYGPEQHRAVNAPWKLRGAQVIDAVTARLCVRFHAISEAVAVTMAQRLHLDPSLIEVVPRARDSTLLGRRTPERRDAARAALGIPDDVRLILAAARHEPQKGLDTLVRAVPALRSALPDVQVLLAGREGSETARLRREVEAAGVSDVVRFLGRRADVPDLMVAADCFVFPSRWEGFGGVLIEALALEVPVVASSIPTSVEVLGPAPGSAGTTFRVDDPAALADAVAHTLEDASTRDRVARGRQLFERRFTLEPVVAQMAEFYERAAL